MVGRVCRNTGIIFFFFGPNVEIHKFSMHSIFGWRVIVIGGYLIFEKCPRQKSIQIQWSLKHSLINLNNRNDRQVFFILLDFSAYPWKIYLNENKPISGNTMHWFFNKNSFVVWKKNDIYKIVIIVVWQNTYKQKIDYW